jgi:hypothetical protein
MATLVGLTLDDSKAGILEVGPLVYRTFSQSVFEAPLCSCYRREAPTQLSLLSGNNSISKAYSHHQTHLPSLEYALFIELQHTNAAWLCMHFSQCELKNSNVTTVL